MKKIYYLLLFLAAGFVNAQIVNIPDPNFKAKLLAADETNSIASTDHFGAIEITFNKIDVNNDGEIQQSEAANIKLLNVSNSNISDLTGIEAFISLQSLECSNNQITSLNVNNSTFLVWLECDNNLLTELEVSNLTALQGVFCNNNQMTNLSLNNLPSLYNLYCGNNQLTSLNLSGTPILFQLGCSNNQLTALDVSGLVNLQIIDCQSNYITALNISALANLQTISCQSNQLTALNAGGLANLQMLNCESNHLAILDVSNATKLEWLYCDNNFFTTLDCNGNTALKGLFISGNPNLTTLFLHNGSDESTYVDSETWLQNWINCPNLHYICADENEIIPLQDAIFTANFPENPLILINSYCSFVPGGNYNTLSGTVKFDADGNGCDSSDPVYPNIKMNLSDGTSSYSAFTGAQGDYKFYVWTGNFTVTPNFENLNFYTISPPSVTHSVAELGNDDYEQHFCITPNGNHQDLEIVIAPIVPARPGFDAVYKIVYHNKGSQVMSQQYGVSFFYNQNLMTFVSADVAPASTGTGALSWTYTDLAPFETRTIMVTLKVNLSTDPENPVNINDELVFSGSISPIGTDEMQVDNYSILNQVAVGSFDPNEIQCLEGNEVSPDQIGNYLHYLIRFENTGTAAAENIVVKTEIDPADFDIESLQLLNSSHNVDARVNGNIIELIFKNIYLETGGHGNILLKVRSKDDLQPGDSVSKKANIYFDYNFPVQTNIANTVFENLSIGDTGNLLIGVSPNPARDHITAKAESPIGSVQVYDAQGRLVQTVIGNENTLDIDLSAMASGLYFFKITCEKGIKTERVIKE